MIFRGVALLVASVGLGFAVVATGIANIEDVSAPARALRYYPFHGEALANQGFGLLEEQGVSGLDPAEAMARRALARDPTAVAAVRTLGYVTDARGNHARAFKLMNQALAINRRDLLTHLWLIEHYVARGDTAHALDQYDVALRTAAAAHTLLLPILVQAASDPEIRRPLAGILAKEPIWAPIFVREFTASGTPVDAVVDLQQLMARAGKPYSAQQTQDLAVRLVAEERFDLAARLLGRDRNPATVIDGKFEFKAPPGVFGWQLQSGYDLGSSADVSPTGNGHVLSIFASPGEAGEVARQLLILKPGRYQLSTVARGLVALPQTQGRWAVTCGGRAGREVGGVALQGGKGAVRTRSEFEVPASGCAAQWLTLNISPFGDNGIQAQLDEIDIQPLR